MKKDSLVYLEDILVAIKKIQRYVENFDFADFEKNEAIQDAVIMRLEVIGEAANRLTDDFLNKNPDFPVSEAVSMRNFLIHDYDEINIETVWKTIKQDLPGLKQVVEKIIG